MAQNYELDDVTIEQTSGLMAQIQEHVKKLRALKWAMIEAEEALKKADYVTVSNEESAIAKVISDIEQGILKI